MHRTLIQLDQTLYERLKEIAFERGISLSAMVRQLLSKAVFAKEKKKSQIRSYKFIGSGKASKKVTAEEHDSYLGEDLV